MGQKRSFDNEELYHISFKHPKVLQKKLVSALEFVPSENVSRQFHNFGQDFFKKYKIEVEQKFKYDGISEIPKNLDQNSKYSSHEYILGSSEEDDHISHKSVPIGPNHQAVIPTWSPPDSKIVKDDEINLIGSCVITMPELDSLEISIGKGRTDCSCYDLGSVRCVRQHVTEAREKLEKIIGHESFVELGFSSMGEEVAKNWSEDDVNLFHEIVFSNPASIGKKMWENLSINFPSRTKQEIVSYYFNVFMLRRRAEQNRSNYMNIDSDDDEWQESEDDDSGIESPDLLDYSNSVSGENKNKIFSDMSFDFPGKNSWENLRDHGESGSGGDGIHNWVDKYMNFSTNNSDFLPTCSVIEEFVGNEDLK